MTVPFPNFDAPHGRFDQPCILDLSRSFSRAGRPIATGIDRVERAYWAELTRRPRPVWAIVRRDRGYALLDRAAAARLMYLLKTHRPVGRLLGRPAPRLYTAICRRRAAACLRRRAGYIGPMAGLMVQLAARFPQGFEYLNVGHSNLDDVFLKLLRRSGAAPLRVKLHDMIPLDCPELVRAGMPERFRARARAALEQADQIICNSAHTAARVTHHAAGLPRRPDCLVAHLGVTVPKDVGRPPVSEPYFVCIGTIEPRKNHALLFEVWQRLADRGGPVPQLWLVGARGWRNAAVFRFLDSSPLMGRYITECAGLPDAEMFALLSGAAGLLFPSREEGFGLPALEARALGVEVICSAIPAFRELLQGDATMLPADDPKLWADAIAARARSWRAGAETAPARPVPSWDQHFAKVFGAEVAGPDQAAQGALTSVRTV